MTRRAEGRYQGSGWNWKPVQCDESVTSLSTATICRPLGRAAWGPGTSSSNSQGSPVKARCLVAGGRPGKEPLQVNGASQGQGTTAGTSASVCKILDKDKELPLHTLGRALPLGNQST